jgi:hypothetical protein
MKQEITDEQAERLYSTGVFTDERPSGLALGCVTKTIGELIEWILAREPIDQGALWWIDQLLEKYEISDEDELIDALYELVVVLKRKEVCEWNQGSANFYTGCGNTAWVKPIGNCEFCGKPITDN